MSENALPTAITAEEEVYLYLLKAIREGFYPGGARLVAEDIAQHMAMSRMPVRAAFRRLASEGLIHSRPNRGYVVSGLTAREMNEVFELRSVLEGLAARLAAPHVEAARIEELVAAMDASGQARSDNWVARHRALHEYVCGLSGRPKLIRQIGALHTQIEPYMRIWFSRQDAPLESRSDHDALIGVLLEGDADRIDVAFQQHILDTAPALIDTLNLK
ncbi:MAG: GntR family transcriptional regulator [Devosia sp.]